MQIFRRRSSDPSPTTADPPSIPENEAAPMPATPLQASRDWNDASQSWTSSSSGPYDINATYTTANNSYTHRRRKSSMITNLVIGSNDPYETTYHDWRLESPPVTGSESKEPRNDWKSRMRTRNSHFKMAKIVFTLIVLVAALLAIAFIVFGEHGSIMEGLKAGDITKCANSAVGRMMIRAKAARWTWNLPKVNLEWDWKWIKETGLPLTDYWHTADLTTTNLATTLLNSEQLIWATPTSVSKVTRAKPETTAQIRLVPDTAMSTGTQMTVVESESEKAMESLHDQSVQFATPPSHVEVLWKKHAYSLILLNNEVAHPSHTLISPDEKTPSAFATVA